MKKIANSVTEDQPSHNYTIEGERKDIAYVGQKSFPDMYQSMGKNEGNLRFQIVGCGDYGESNFRILLRMLHDSAHVEGLSEYRGSNNSSRKKDQPRYHILGETVVDDMPGMDERACRQKIDDDHKDIFSSPDFGRFFEEMKGQYPSIFDNMEVLRKFGLVEKTAAILVLGPEDRILCLQEAGGRMSLPVVKEIRPRDNIASKFEQAVYDATGIDIVGVRVFSTENLVALKMDFVGATARMAASTSHELRKSQDVFKWIHPDYLSDFLDPQSLVFAKTIRKSVKCPPVKVPEPSPE